MRLKIISPDGLPRTTKVLNAESGEELERVVSVEWRISGTGRALCTLQVLDVEVDVVGDTADV